MSVRHDWSYDDPDSIELLAWSIERRRRSIDRWLHVIRLPLIISLIGSNAIDSNLWRTFGAMMLSAAIALLISRPQRVVVYKGQPTNEGAICGD